MPPVALEEGRTSAWECAFMPAPIHVPPTEAQASPLMVFLRCRCAHGLLQTLAECEARRPPLRAALPQAAEGRREAAFRAAEARERTAQAEATATRLVSEATAAGDPAAINYLVADKYVRALQAFAESPNQKVFIVPMELASLAGTLGGIGQIAAAALGGNHARGAVPQVAVEALGKNAVEAALARAAPDGSELN
jgi:hypothetical protein